MTIRKQFANRCNEIMVPTPLRYAAFHQVRNCGLTMIVTRDSPDEIHAWFRNTQSLNEMWAKLFILHGK